MISLFCRRCKRVLPFEAFGGPGHEEVCRSCERAARAEAAGCHLVASGVRPSAVTPTQLTLFAPRRTAPSAGCPRVPGPLCRDGREGRCPGGARCEELGEQEAARLAKSAAVVPHRSTGSPAARRRASSASERSMEARRSADFAGVVDQDRPAVDLTPEELAAPCGADLGVSEFGTGQSPAPRPPPGCGPICQDARDGKCPGKERCDEMPPSDPPCGACGSTTGAVFYERGPLAGLRRCWPCAKPALTEVHDG